MPNQRLTPLAALAALLLCPLLALAQAVKMPAEVKIAPNRMAAVTIEYDGDEIKWTTPPELDVFREYDPDPKKIRLRLIGYTAGSYHVHAVTCKGGKLSDFATCTVVVGDPVPVPPGPTPGPGPTPPTPPAPPSPPAPIPVDGFRCLIVYESSELGKLPATQQAVISGKAVRDYLNAHCPASPIPGQKEWWMLDKDADVSALAKHWQDAMRRPRNSVPWLILSNGKTGFEGPLPATVEEFLSLAKKYGGD